MSKTTGVNAASDDAALLARARGGDGDAFRLLASPYQRELLVHCYRMLGSFQDAEDAVQETMLAAWQGLGEYAERASLRTWLYRVATNRCLNALRSARRRPRTWNVPGVEPPEPSRHGEVVWLQPFPDALLDDVAARPEARYEQRDAVSLAFVTALQRLPPRQVAVLVLRDVLGFRAREVAAMLDTSVEAVTSALKRARASVAHAHSEPVSAVAEHAVVQRFVRAWEAADVDGLVTLLTDDVFMAMPPMPYEYAGIDAVARFSATLFNAGRRFQLRPTRANGQPAFGAYLRSPGGKRHGTGLFVLTVVGDRITGLTHFENTVLPWFGLPAHL